MENDFFELASVLGIFFI